MPCRWQREADKQRLHALQRCNLALCHWHWTLPPLHHPQHVLTPLMPRFLGRHVTVVCAWNTLYRCHGTRMNITKQSLLVPYSPANSQSFQNIWSHDIASCLVFPSAYIILSRLPDFALYMQVLRRLYSILSVSKDQMLPTGLLMQRCGARFLPSIRT